MSMTLKTTKNLFFGLSVVFKITTRRSTIDVRKKSDPRKNRTTGPPGHVRKISDQPQPVNRTYKLSHVSLTFHTLSRPKKTSTINIWHTSAILTFHVYLLLFIPSSMLPGSLLFHHNWILYLRWAPTGMCSNGGLHNLGCQVSASFKERRPLAAGPLVIYVYNFEWRNLVIPNRWLFLVMFGITSIKSRKWMKTKPWLATTALPPLNETSGDSFWTNQQSSSFVAEFLTNRRAC